MGKYNLGIDFYFVVVYIIKLSSMKKKTVYPRCLATVSGKHNWIELNSEEHPHIMFEHPVCEYCEIIDDTVILKQESRQEGRVAYS